MKQKGTGYCIFFFLQFNTLPHFHLKCEPFWSCWSHKEKPKLCSLQALSIQMLVTWNSLFGSSHHHCFWDIVANKTRLSLPWGHSMHMISVKGVASLSTVWRFMSGNYMMNLLRAYRLYISMPRIPSRNLITMTHLTGRKKSQILALLCV